MNNEEDIERFDNDLFRASDGKWIKFSDHEYAVQQIQKSVAEQTRELRQKLANEEYVSHNNYECAQKAEQQLATLRAKADSLSYTLSQIIHDLPVNRNWLNPDIEHLARAALSAYLEGE